MHLAPDVFVLPGPDAGSALVYAPLHEVLLHVNRAAARCIERLAADPTARAEGVEERAVIDELVRLGVAGKRPLAAPAPDSRERAFIPTSVSLFLTSRCNLRCTYCYAAAGSEPQTMAWPLARRALDRVVDNAVAAGRSRFGVTVHGGGEPTVAWSLLERVVAYANERAEREALTVRIGIGTNGVLPEARARWLTRHLQHATVSLDGPPAVHDVARPTASGASSHASVLRTLRVFDQERLSYGIRMTVTAASVDRLPDAVTHVMESCAARDIQAEPVFAQGRARDPEAGPRAPEPERFIAAFRRAARLARAQGRRLIYSGARLGVLTDRFCEAVGRSFAVTPTGAVTSCYEVSDAADPRAARFFWGRYDAATDTFVLDEARRRALARLGAYHRPACRDCFCRWHCAGDCAAKVAVDAIADPSPPPRCIINQALTRDQLLRALRGSPDARAAGPPSCGAPTPSMEAVPCT